MRLIDAEALKEDALLTPVFRVSLGDVRDVEDLVDDAPTIEAEPVRHSKWLQHRMSVPKGKGQTYLVYGCWMCHGHVKKRSPYCPSCGAKMDAEVHDDA